MSSPARRVPATPEAITASSLNLNTAAASAGSVKTLAPFSCQVDLFLPAEEGEARCLCRSVSDSGLLLSQAVKSPKPPDQIRAIDRDDSSFRKTILENFVSALVPG